MHVSEEEETSRRNLSQIPVVYHYRSSGDALSVHLVANFLLAAPAIYWCALFRNGARRSRSLARAAGRHYIIFPFADVVTKSSNITSRPLLFVATGYCTTRTAFGEIGHPRARGDHSALSPIVPWCLRVSNFFATFSSAAALSQEINLE